MWDDSAVPFQSRQLSPSTPPSDYLDERDKDDENFNGSPIPKDTRRYLRTVGGQTAAVTTIEAGPLSVSEDHLLRSASKNPIINRTISTLPPEPKSSSKLSSRKTKSTTSKRVKPKRPPRKEYRNTGEPKERELRLPPGDRIVEISSSGRKPEFSPYYTPHKQPSFINEMLFKQLKNDREQKKKLPKDKYSRFSNRPITSNPDTPKSTQLGFIYAYKSPSAPEHIKIGCGKYSEDRIKAWGKCAIPEEPIHDPDNRAVLRYSLVERLIHTELADRRRKFQCWKCKSYSKTRTAKRNGAGPDHVEYNCHDEWFEVSPEKALSRAFQRLYSNRECAASVQAPSVYRGRGCEVGRFKTEGLVVGRHSTFLASTEHKGRCRCDILQS